MSMVGPGTLPGVVNGGTLNVYSAARDVIAFPCEAPHWVDLSLGFAYCIVIANQTGVDIDSGEINLQGADADPDDPCAPGTFRDLDPVNDCGQLVTGIPWDPPVRIPITPERPIRAHGVCMYAVPCPLQFMQITGVPAGTMAIAIVTRLRRTNFDHYGPYGGIIPPMQLATPFSAQLPGGQQAQLTDQQQRGQQQGQQPGQQQDQRRRREQPQPQPAQPPQQPPQQQPPQQPQRAPRR